MYNYIYQRTGNHGDAEDLTARTFLKAFVHLQRYRFRGIPFAAWLYRIAHNAVANWHRDSHRHQPVKHQMEGVEQADLALAVEVEPAEVAGKPAGVVAGGQAGGSRCDRGAQPRG